jgi:hypothetical protein
VLERELVAQVERTAAGIGPEEIGLSQEEGKKVLRSGAGSHYPDAGRCRGSRSQAMRSVGAKAAH